MEQKSVKNYKTLIEAEMARNFLETRGIKSVIQKQGFFSDSGVSSANMLGVDLFVLEKDYEKSKELLDSFQTKKPSKLKNTPLTTFVIFLYSSIVLIFPAIFFIIVGVVAIWDPLLRDNPSQIAKTVYLPIAVGLLLIGFAIFYIKKAIKN